MAQDEGTAPMPWLVNDMEALEDAYDQHVRRLLEKLAAFLAHSE